MRNSQTSINAGFIGVLLLLLAVGAVGLFSLAESNGRLDRIVNLHNIKVELVAAMRGVSRDRALALHRMTLAEDALAADEDIQAFSELAGQFIGLREKMEKLPMNAREKAVLTEALGRVREAVPAQQGVVDHFVAGRLSEANRLLIDRAIPAQNDVIAAFNKLVVLQREASDAAVSEANTYYTFAFRLTLGLGLLAMVLGAAIMFLVSRRAAEVNALLEARVIERTQALQATNDELQATVQTLRDTQQQLVEAEKMASLGDLVAGVAHEINTPIGIGVTSASTLSEDLHALRVKLDGGSMTRTDLSSFMTHAQQASDIMLRNMQRAAALIGSFKQVAVDQTSSDLRTIDLREYVDEILTSIRPKFKRSSVAVENACAEGLMFHTYPGAIYQVVSNLVLNAIVHAFDGGDTPGRIVIAARRDGAERIVLDVIDDGKGIDSDSLGRVFEPFFTTRRGQGGSGLGLSIVYNLVTKTLQGRIKVTSTPGHGATFSVDIPTMLAKAASASH